METKPSCGHCPGPGFLSVSQTHAFSWWSQSHIWCELALLEPGVKWTHDHGGRKKTPQGCSRNRTFPKPSSPQGSVGSCWTSSYLWLGELSKYVCQLWGNFGDCSSFYLCPPSAVSFRAGWVIPANHVERFYTTFLWHARAQSCPILCKPMNCSPPPSSVHEISQARIVEWVAISSSRGSSQPRNQTHVSCIGRWILYH